MVYLDYAATSPLLDEARVAMRRAEEKFFANASALHTPGHLAMSAIDEVRQKLAEMIGARPEEIIFTAGASEANNTVIHTFAGHQIETSPLEHHSVLEAARQYRGDKWPKLYSYMLANNETGELVERPKMDATPAEPVERLKMDATPADYNSEDELFKARDDWGHELVTDRRAMYLHSDLTQVLGKMPIDVNELGLDYATFSAHKIGGPLGVGALYVRSGVPYRPLIIGGGQEKKRRGGTYNTVGIVGFGAALDYIVEHDTIKTYQTKVRKLRDTLAKRIISKIPGSSLNTDLGPARSLPNILNVSFRAAEGEAIQLYLDAEGIVVSTGSACAAGDTQPSHVLMAKTGDAEVAHSSIRFSFGTHSTMAEVDRVMEVLPGIIDRLQKMSTIII